MTTLLAMVSPAQDFCKESNNTLLFAQSCKQVQNMIRKNKFSGSIPKDMPYKTKEKTTIQKAKAVEKNAVPWELGTKP